MNLSVFEEKQFELKKHVNAIHCTNNLSLVQRKLFNALLFNAYPTLLHQSRFQILAKEVCALIGYNSNDYAKLKRALLGLITVAVEWNIIDCDTGIEKKWKASSILASAELANGVCVYEYSHIMRELLFQPEIYGRINMTLMAKFKSSYGLALYENCIRYQRLPQTPWFPLELFRKLMGVMGTKYSKFKDFKKRVLNTAINEVNAISSINIEAEIERKNQKVVKIRFKLTKSKRDENFKRESVSVDKDLRQLLMEVFSFSEEMIQKAIGEYGAKYLKEKVNMIVESDSFQAGKIRGLTGYLIDALRKNYLPSKSSKKMLDDRRKNIEQQELMRKKKEEDREKRYDNYVNNKITKYLKSLKNDEYNDLLLEFDNYINEANNIIRSWYKKHKLEHPAVKGFFNNFIKSHKKQKIGEILSFDEFQLLVSEYS